MTDTLSFTVPGEPTPKARARVVKGRTYTPERTRLAEEAVMWEAIKAGAVRVFSPPESGRRADSVSHFGLLVMAYCKSKRAINSDEDNFLKLVQDALEGIVWHNDNQVFDGHCIKVPVKDNPRTEIEIWRME